MVFLQGVAAAALVPLEDQPGLRVALVVMMIVATSAITITVLYIVVYFAHTKPGLLFPIGDLDPDVQRGVLEIPTFAPEEQPDQKTLAVSSESEFPVFWAEVEEPRSDI